LRSSGSLQRRYSDARKVIEDGAGWSGANGNLEEDGGRRRTLRSNSTRRVDEDANPLIARTREVQALRLLPYASVDFGDRDRPVIEPDERFQELRRNAWGERRHDATLVEGIARECSSFDATFTSNTVSLA
jgi:hypothetical protein